MLSEKECQAIIDKGIKYAKAQNVDIEIVITQDIDNNSRFANNHMTQNQNSSTVNISLRVIKNKKQAKYSINQTDDESIKNGIDEGIKLLALVPNEAENIDLPMPQPKNSVNRFNKATANFSANDRAKAIESVCQIASQNKLKASGLLENEVSVLAIGNSNNLFQYYPQSFASFSLTMTQDDAASGWTKIIGTDIGKFNFIDTSKKVAKNTISAKDPIDIEPGHYTVILPAIAVSDLLGNLWWSFTATSFKDKLSCFLDKLNKPVLGKNITIYDDVFNELQLGAPFDGEGVDTKKVLLVENGILKNLVYNRANAKFYNTEATGHSLPQPSTQGEYPSNIVMLGGDSTIEDMVSTTDRGILLTRVWYVREVDPTSKIVTGMTRDGTFLVENGKVTSAIKNLRFNESLIEMLNKVEMLGKPELIQGEESNPVVVPALKVAYFNFESATKF